MLLCLRNKNAKEPVFKDMTICPSIWCNCKTENKLRMMLPNVIEILLTLPFDQMLDPADQESGPLSTQNRVS